jgi:hypothetical protein
MMPCKISWLRKSNALQLESQEMRIKHQVEKASLQQEMHEMHIKYHNEIMVVLKNEGHERHGQGVVAGEISQSNLIYNMYRTDSRRKS